MHQINAPLHSVANPENRNIAGKTCLVLGVPLAMLLCSLVIVQAAHADTKKPDIAVPDAKQAALLLEIRKNLTQRGKYSAAEIDGVIAELRNKSLEEIKAIADFAGSKTTGAERLVGARIRACGSRLAGSMRCRIGRANAAVLPVPVCA